MVDATDTSTLATTLTAAEAAAAAAAAEAEPPTRRQLAGRLDELLDELDVWTYTPTEIGGVTIGRARIVGRYSQGGSGLGGCTRASLRYLLDGELLFVGLRDEFLDERGNWQSLDGWDVDGEQPSLASIETMQRVVDGLAEWRAANVQARLRLERSIDAAAGV